MEVGKETKVPELERRLHFWSPNLRLVPWQKFLSWEAATSERALKIKSMEL